MTLCSLQSIIVSLLLAMSFSSFVHARDDKDTSFSGNYTGRIFVKQPLLASKKMKAGKDYDGYPDPFFVLQAGAFIALFNANSSFELNTASGTGTIINLRKDLSFKKEGYYPRADLLIRLAKRHQLGFSFFYTGQKRTATLNRAIQYGDSTYQINSSVTGKNQFYSFGAEYRFSIVRKPRWEVGILIGGKIFNIHTSLRANLNNNTYTNSKIWNAPVPLPGIHGSFNFGQHITFRATAEYFMLHLNKWNFNALDLRPSLEFYLFKNVGLGLAYQYFSTTIRKDPIGKFNGELKYSFNAGSLFLCARF